VLISGGSSGTGLALAKKAHRLGATVVAGGRSQDRLAALAAELGGDRFHPFIADLTDESAVGKQLDSLLAQGVRPTDLVHSAAGGFEPVTRRLVRRCVALRRVPQDQLAAALDSARHEVEEWVAETIEGAMSINRDASRAFIDQVAARLPAGGSVSVYSGLWSTFYGRTPTPGFYRGIAESKLALEEWLEQRASSLAERGITTAIISGHIITDTSMGELIDRFLVPLMSEAQQARFRSYYITTADMVRATITVLVEAPGHAERGRLVRTYVIGPGQILDELAPSTPALADLIPL